MSIVNYSTDVFDKIIEDFYEKIKTSYDCVISNPCSTIQEFISNTLTQIEGLKSLDWECGDDQAGLVFLEYINGTMTSLNSFLTSISSSFIPSENAYKAAYEEIETLKSEVKVLDRLIKDEPKMSDSIYNKSIYNYELNKYEKKFDYSQYNSDHTEWDKSCFTQFAKCGEIAGELDSQLKILASIDVAFNVELPIISSKQVGVSGEAELHVEWLNRQSGLTFPTWWNGKVAGPNACHLVSSANALSICLGFPISPEELNELASYWYKNEGRSKGLSPGESPTHVRNIEAYCAHAGLPITILNKNDREGIKAAIEATMDGEGTIIARQKKYLSNDMWRSNNGHYFEIVGGKENSSSDMPDIMIWDPVSPSSKNNYINRGNADSYIPYSELEKVLQDQECIIYIEAGDGSITSYEQLKNT